MKSVLDLFIRLSLFPLLPPVFTVPFFSIVIKIKEIKHTNVLGRIIAIKICVRSDRSNVLIQVTDYSEAKQPRGRPSLQYQLPHHSCRILYLTSNPHL